MFHPMTRGAAIAALLLAAACSPGSEQPEAPVANAQEGALPLPMPTLATGPAVSIARTTDGLDFTYSYPNEAAALPALDAWLRKDAEAGERDANAALAKAPAGERRHIYSKRWSVQANAPGILSLTAQYIRTRGEEPVPLMRTLLWDRQAAQPVAFATLFSDYAAILPSLQGRACTAFAEERRRRQSPATGPCPPLEQLHIGLASGAAIGPVRMLRLFADPGAAAPAEEGSYEARLPVDDAMVRAVRPEYRGAFAPAL